MVKQVIVGNIIHTSMRKEQIDVFSELLTYNKRVMQFLNQILLFNGQLAWIRRIYSREMTAFHLIFFTVNRTSPLLVIKAFEEVSPLHSPLWMFLEHCGLQFKLDYRNGLMHHRSEPYCLFIYKSTSSRKLWYEFLTRVIPIGFKCKCCKRNQIDAITIFKSSHIGISK